MTHISPIAVTCALATALGLVVGCNAAPPNARQASVATRVKNGISERELVADVGLTARPNNVVVLSLEPPSGSAREDTGTAGVDAVPITLDRAGSYTLQAGIAPAHTVRLLDGAGNELLSMPGTGKVSRTLAAGRYVLELRSGAAPGAQEEPIFIQLGTQTGLSTKETDLVASKASWLINTNNCGGCDLTGADLLNANLSGALLQNAVLYNAILTGADLSGANLTYTDSRRANFYKANLTKTDFSNSVMDGALLTGATQTGTIFTGVSLTNVIF